MVQLIGPNHPSMYSRQGNLINRTFPLIRSRMSLMNQCTTMASRVDTFKLNHYLMIILTIQIIWYSFLFRSIPTSRFMDKLALFMYLWLNFGFLASHSMSSKTTSSLMKAINVLLLSYLWLDAPYYSRFIVGAWIFQEWVREQIKLWLIYIKRSTPCYKGSLFNLSI